MDRFLVQVNATIGYANINNNRRYANAHWAKKPRDSDHGEVKPGDELLVYCTGSVPNYGMSLAFSVSVRAVSPDRITFDLDEPRWFPSPLSRMAIHSLVADGKLSNVFRRCGIQWFNITKLEPLEAQQVLQFLEVESSVEQEAGLAGSPADRLIEVHLEQWLVRSLGSGQLRSPAQTLRRGRRACRTTIRHGKCRPYRPAV